ncbi:MAG: AAA family ATPase [Promethearchaeota archaeon]
MFAIDERMKSLGWWDFPFRIDVMPEIFAGEERIISPLMTQLRTGNIILIEGRAGTGKTHVLRWFLQKLNTSTNMIPCSISEPVNTRILSAALTALISRNTMKESGSPPELIDTLSENVQEFYMKKRRRIVLLVDEGQTLALEVGDSESVIAEKRKTVQWLRHLSDSPAIVLFMAGLTGFQKALTTIFGPLAERVTYKMMLERRVAGGHLEVLTREETEELIRLRIQHFGGNGIAPFTPGAIDEIHRHSRGYPRPTLRFCENIITLAFQEDNPAGDRITSDFVLQAIHQQPSPPEETTLVPSSSDSTRFVKSERELELDSYIESDADGLTAIQRDILDLIHKLRKATSAVVAEELGIAKGTASNELKKLYDLRKLRRRKASRGYEYHPN